MAARLHEGSGDCSGSSDGDGVSGDGDGRGGDGVFLPPFSVKGSANVFLMVVLMEMVKVMLHVIFFTDVVVGYESEVGCVSGGVDGDEVTWCCL